MQKMDSRVKVSDFDVSPPPMPQISEIELHNGEHQRRRLTINTRCSVLNVPVFAADGIGQISYMASGLHTDDGVEIWTPQKLARQ